jgi:hypothetical protein
MKGQQVKHEKQLRVSKLYLFICVFNIMKVMLSNKCYDNSECTAMSMFLWLIHPKPTMVRETAYNTER